MLVIMTFLLQAFSALVLLYVVTACDGLAVTPPPPPGEPHGNGGNSGNGGGGGMGM
jgi:hypothetical protein